VSQAFGNSSFWLFWFLILAWMRRRTGMNHPPTDEGELSPKRRLVAWGCLALFVLLFMPTPWASYGSPAPEPDEVKASEGTSP
jgi:hypothetical protein